MLSNEPWIGISRCYTAQGLSLLLCAVKLDVYVVTGRGEVLVCINQHNGLKLTNSLDS
jgi:hypothetical protein